MCLSTDVMFVCRLMSCLSTDVIIRIELYVVIHRDTGNIYDDRDTQREKLQRGRRGHRGDISDDRDTGTQEI